LKTSTTTSAGSTTTGTAAHWAQCGGQGYTGPLSAPRLTLAHIPTHGTRNACKFLEKLLGQKKGWKLLYIAKSYICTYSCILHLKNWCAGSAGSRQGR
jgi:hypothetical protein